MPAETAPSHSGSAQRWSRRLLLKAAALFLAALPLGAGRSRGAAEDQELLPEPPPEYTLAERLEPVLQGREPTEGRVRLELPEVVEDGSVVPIMIGVDSPMTEADHVRALHLFVDNNPDPHILTLEPSPALGAAEWRFKIRMRETTTVRAIAEMSDGRLYQKRIDDVVVHLSGCG